MVTLTHGVMVVDIVEEDNERLRVRMKISEGRAAGFHVQRPSLEDVPDRKSRGRAEAGAAVVHDAVSSDVFGCDLVHAAAAGKRSDSTILHQRRKQII